MNVKDKTVAFIANRDKLCISPEVAEIVYDNVEKNEVLQVATIHWDLKIPEVKGEIALEYKRNPCKVWIVWNLEKPVIDMSRK